VFDFSIEIFGKASWEGMAILLIKSTKSLPTTCLLMGRFPEKMIKNVIISILFAFPFPKRHSQKKCNYFINLSIPKTFSYYVRECMRTAYSLTLSFQEWRSGKGEEGGIDRTEN